MTGFAVSLLVLAAVSRIAGVAAVYIPGLRLAREFCAAVVRPLLEEHFPQVPYAAALLGAGSEVAGFDSQRSTEHDWGPRLQIFLTDSDAAQASAMAAMLASGLPASFRGYPVAFPVTRKPGGTTRHRVEVAGLSTWLTGQLGFDPRREVTLLDWLAIPTQRPAEFTTGEVFHDRPGDLTRVRARADALGRLHFLRVCARAAIQEPFGPRT
jgi:hypothetical protein